LQIQSIKRLIADTTNRVMLDHTLSFAAALSYYFVMAFFPALIMLAALLAFLPIPNLFDTMISALARVAPSEGMGLVRAILADVVSPSRGFLLSFGVLGVLWSCSSGFAAIIEALDVAFDVPETRPIWKTRLLSLELSLLIGGQVTVAFAFMVVGPQFGALLVAHLGIHAGFVAAWPVLRYVFSFSFIVIAVEELYLLAPNIKQRFAETLPGAIVAVAGWILLSDALSYYFRHVANLNRTYGVLGGGVALLIWLYWSGFLMLVGAALNSQIVRHKGMERLRRKPVELGRV